MKRKWKKKPKRIGLVLMIALLLLLVGSCLRQKESAPAPSIYIRLEMNHVAGYAPCEEDVFTLTFRQLDNLGKYWPTLATTQTQEAVVAPRIEQPIAPKKCCAMATTAQWKQDKKQADVQVFLPEITQPGRYVYEMTLQVPDELRNSYGWRTWQEDAEKTYLVTVEVLYHEGLDYTNADDGYDYEVCLYDEAYLAHHQNLKQATFPVSVEAYQKVILTQEVVSYFGKNLPKNQRYPLTIEVTGLNSEQHYPTNFDGWVLDGANPTLSIELRDQESLIFEALPVGCLLQITVDGQTEVSDVMYRYEHQVQALTPMNTKMDFEAMITMNRQRTYSFENQFTLSRHYMDTQRTRLYSAIAIAALLGIAGVIGGFVYYKWIRA